MKLLPRSLAWLLVVGWIIPATAETAKAVATTNRPSKHCLWEVKGASNVVYLLGSMHVMKEDMYPLAPEIEAAYQRAAILVFETDMDQLESPALALKLATKASYPEGDSLKNHVSPTVYALLATNLQGSFLPMEMVDRFKPWMAAMTVLLVELQKQGFDVQNGLDRHFANRAKTDQKSLEYFEEPEFQINLLTSLGDKESEEFLGQALKDMEVFKTEFAKLAAAWQTGDLQALDELILKSFREYPTMHQKFLLDRNHSWIPKLEKLLHGESDALVVVGAGHMIGKEGVVDLLQAKGYQIQQQ